MSGRYYVSLPVEYDVALDDPTIGYYSPRGSRPMAGKQMQGLSVRSQDAEVKD